MNLLQEIIKILHQPVQLLIAALMYAYKEPKRKFWLIRAVLAAILGFLVLEFCITASPEILLNNFLASLVWSIGSFLILLSIEYSMFDVELKMAAYFTTLAYLTQHVAFCAWDAIQPGAGYNEPHYCSLKDIVVDTFIPFAVFALVYVVIYLLIARPMVKHGYASVSVGYSFTTMIAVLLISIVFSSVVQTSFQHQNYLYRCCRIYSMICCVLILWQQVSFQNKLAQQEELSLQKQLWMRHQAQYERASDSVKLINHKCHAAEDIAVVNHDLKIEDMKGLAYDDPKWNDFLEQIPVSEMVNLVSNGGWATQEVPSVGKLGYTEVDGPNGINNIMAGSTGNQFCAQSVLACSWNTELAYDMGETFAQEAVAMKIAALYAPAMNIHRSPFSGRNYEYYSEDGLHSGKMAAAETQGIQSQGVTTYCKHFAVNDQESNRDSGGLLTWVNEQAMREIYIKPFEIAVKEGGTRGIMSSFNRIGEICAAENADLLTTVLRNEWGFRGTVITDCILQLSYINIDRAIAAGNDLILSLMNMQAPSEAVTNSPAGHQVLRTATHNILYTSANSIGQEVSAIPVPYWLYITVAVVDAGLIALCVFYFVRRRKNVKRWKEQNSVQA